MRIALTVTLLVVGTGLALAQSSAPSSGPSAPGAGTAPPPAVVAPGTTPAPGSGVPPSTPSQQNLDTAPPGRNLPSTQGNATPQPNPNSTTPPSQNTATPPGQNTAQPGQNPPASGGRPQPGGATSSQQSVQNRTGKNPANESYTSCLSMWDSGTHMSKTEWSRACRRVDNRLQNLKVGDVPAVPAPRKSRRAEGGMR